MTASRRLSVFIGLLWLASACAQALGSDFKPISGADGTFETLRENGGTLWRTVKDEKGDYAPYIYFRAERHTHPGDTYYVEINFKDVGTGVLSLDYNAADNHDY